jgi:hypothetical protein
MPGLITGVAVRVGTDRRVGVAEGGNQTMVAVGVAVSVETTVGVGSGAATGRQAGANKVIPRRTKPNEAPWCRRNKILPEARRLLPRQRAAARNDISNKSLITE